MFEAAFWGLVQGLTEFLPVSSSGHLVLVPALFNMKEPGLEVTAVLHLGTLAAVVVYFWDDLRRLAGFRKDTDARRLLLMLVIGTVPAAVIGFLAEGLLDELFEEPRRVALALMITGAVLLASRLIGVTRRRMEGATILDAWLIGFAQATALVPGISRSGTTIVAGMMRGLSRTEAARFSFLLGVPAIVGGGLIQAIDLADQGGLSAEVLVGALVAAVVGYFSISALLRLLAQTGLGAFGIYCVAFGAISLVFV